MRMRRKYNNKINKTFLLLDLTFCDIGKDFLNEAKKMEKMLFIFPASHRN